MNSKDLISIDSFKIITQSVTEIDDIEAMATYLCNLLTSTLDIKGCSIYILNDDQDELELLASHGLSSDYLLKGPIDAKKSIKCIKENKPIIIKNIKDPRLQYPKQAEQEGIMTIVAIPMFFHTKPVGSIRLYSSTKWDISSRDLETLEILAELMSMALKYAKLVTTLATIKEIIDEV